TGGVALRRQQLRDCNLPQSQTIRGASDRHLVCARSDGVTAGNERRTRGRALRLDVEIEQPHAFGGELVNAWCWRAAQDAAAVTTQLAVGQVVHEHEDDIGRFALIWSRADVLGLFSNNVVSFSRNVVLKRGCVWSGPFMFSVRYR